MLSVVLLVGCALQPDYQAPVLEKPVAWTQDVSGPAADVVNNNPEWWRQIHDPAVNTLVDAALKDNPSLEQALARIDEARATLGVSSAQQLPAINASGGIERASVQNTTGAGSRKTIMASSATVSPQFSWELDLFGRIRQSVDSASRHLEARTADAAETRLALIANVIDNVLNMRACDYARQVQIDDIASRQSTLVLTRRKLASGFVARVDEARAVSGLADVQTSLAAQTEQCGQIMNALVALSGQNMAAIRLALSLALPVTIPVTDEETTTLSSGQAGEKWNAPMPRPPRIAPDIPATVLLQHPNMIAAERDTAAAWADIGVARANRFPQINLAGLLTGQWLRSAGSTLDLTTWSAGPAFSAVLFDGGAGRSNVDAAQARYRQAVASLRSVLRSTIQDTENALAAKTSASARLVSTRVSADAAQVTFIATEAQWRAGSVSMFELEDARRQLASARSSAINAARDDGQAWVALIKASGNAVGQPDTPDASASR